MANPKNTVLTVVGGGLAGSEAAWQAAEIGVTVRLIEMRPKRMTPAHHTGNLAELVCSNSFRGNAIENAVGLLKEEMRRLGSLIMSVADEHQVPAGGALAVDREAFSAGVTDRIRNHPNITVLEEEQQEIPDGPAIIATGPLTSDALSQALKEFSGEGSLSYYDAAAPLVSTDSLNMDRLYRASRYGKGGDDAYLNAPLDRATYEQFLDALLAADQHEGHDFEQGRFFEGCLPIEEMARRGRDTLRFGPMKPVGLPDPKTGKEPYAVLQLRQDNKYGTLYNLVGFQTSLRWGDQKSVFRLIPGLEDAEFERYGVIHRNTFLQSPRLLHPTLQSRQRKDLFFAGQMIGVEGYVESAASGLVAGLNAARLLHGEAALAPPVETAVGALCHYVSTANPETFQPMNVAFGLMPPLRKGPRRRREKRRAMAERALMHLDEWREKILLVQQSTS